MECPDCGYFLGPFEKECPRCPRLKVEQVNILVPVPPTLPMPQEVALPKAEPGNNFCVKCGTGRVAQQPFCPQCGQAFKIEVLPEPPAMRAKTDPAQALLTTDYNPLYGGNPHNIKVVVNNTQNGGMGSSAGWLAALFLLLYGSPLGCILVPVTLVLAFLFFGVVYQFIPIIVALAVAGGVFRMPMSQEDKAKVCGGILLAGLVANVFWWQNLHPAVTN